MDEIQNKLNELWAGVIDFYKFDIFKHTITLDVTVIENGEERRYNVKFKDVSAYHFYENSGEERINPLELDEGDYLELTSIQFFENGVGDIRIKSKTEKWVEQYYSNANFVLEIWESMLFIEASSIIINDVDEYKVKIK
jgi:hypothetical protein